MVINSSGLSYEAAKEFCARTNSYILTDSMAKMEEIDKDRSDNKTEMNRWTQIGFSVNSLDLKTLDGIDFSAVLKIRDKGYLDGLRKLMSDVWGAVPDNDTFSEGLSDSFRIELRAKIAEAEKEWAAIDHSLLSYFTTESFLGGGLAIATGTALMWPAAALAIVGAVNVTQSRMQRSNFLKYYPAGTMIKRIRRETLK